MMRLRLRIYRNELPAVSALWPVPDTQFKNTIAQLLEHVNRTFPLESDTWGLEHYVVLIGGYECLHYQEVGAVCRDDDEIVIRPLQHAETRARTLAGRHQITNDGRHLVDGLPFGRPLLRLQPRPEVRIPAMKRTGQAALEELNDLIDDTVNMLASLEGIESSAELRQEVRQVLKRKRSMDAYGEEMVYDGSLSRANGDFMGSSGGIASSKRRKLENGYTDDLESASNKLGEKEEAVWKGASEDDADSESDADYEEGGESGDEGETESSQASSSEESSDMDDGIGTSSESEEDSASSDPEWDGLTDDTTAQSSTVVEREPLSRANMHHKISDAASEHATTTEVASDNQSKSTTLMQRPTPLQNLTPYGQGQESTKKRNARKRDSKHLAHLKRTGELPESATLSDLRRWKESGREAQADLDNVRIPMQSSLALHGSGTVKLAPHSSYVVLHDTLQNGPRRIQMEQERLKQLDSIASGGIDVDAPTNGELFRLMESQTHMAIAAQGNSGQHQDGAKWSEIDISDEEEAPEQASTKASAADLNGQAAAADIVDVDGASSAMDAQSAQCGAATSMVPPAVTRRSKVDLASSQRLVYGSLGVRAPKTQQDREALQKHFAAPTIRLQRTTLAKAAMPTGTGEAGDEDEEMWRSKIKLTAVECCEQGTALSTPPFPFYQRWDPQQRKKKAPGKEYKAQKQKKRQNPVGVNGDYVESYDKYNPDENGDALEYDDVDEDQDYWEDGALLGGSEPEEEGGALASKSHVIVGTDDYPPLPGDITTLPTINEGEAQKGDILTFQELVCSAGTGWQPSMRSRTAQVIEHEGEVWTLRLALRDLPPKTYDAEGKRVYTGFEMEGVSDDEDEDSERTREVKWRDLGEVKLVLRAPNAKT